MSASLVVAALGLTLESRSSLPARPATVHAFLSTPSNWPRIVASSQSIAGYEAGEKMGVGDTVAEIFGAPPLLPLQVSWECTRSDAEKGVLRFNSPDGLEGVARNCEMDFAIKETNDGCDVSLKMSFDATSPLAVAASPVLAADNALAIKVLLRRALDSDGLLLSSAASPLGTMDPIAGPIVKLGRRLGLMPEEEDDGWTGEPTAWAKPDSVPQKLSELTSTRLAGFKQWTAELVAGDFDAAAVDARLEREIASGGVVMFSFTSCPFCKNAKELLDTKGARYMVLELDLEEEGAALRARLGARTGRTSVPSVWIGGDYCGGLNDGPGLAPLDADGLLEPRLRAVGAIP